MHYENICKKNKIHGKKWYQLVTKRLTLKTKMLTKITNTSRTYFLNITSSLNKGRHYLVSGLNIVLFLNLVLNFTFH